MFTVEWWKGIIGREANAVGDQNVCVDVSYLVKEDIFGEGVVEIFTYLFKKGLQYTVRIIVCKLGTRIKKEKRNTNGKNLFWGQ